MAGYDHYSILGVDENASVERIKTAFRRLALKYHPDKNPDDPQAIEIFTAIHKAYGILSNPETRKAYDLSRASVKKIILPQPPVRTIVDRSKIKIQVDRRVIRFDEFINVTISIFDKHSKVTMNGLHRFDVMQGPVINSLFPPDANTPELEISYILKPKEQGYIEIGPAAFVSRSTKYLAESIHIKVNPLPDMVRLRPISNLEKFQSVMVALLIFTYTILIAYNIYRFDIYPRIRNNNLQRISQPAAPVTQSLGDAHLSTGESPYDGFFGKGRFDNGSFNRVMFHNSRMHDAVVLLTESNTHQIIRNNYIRAGEDFIMQQIPDGSYYLKVVFGNDWNDDLPVYDKQIRGGFNKNVRYEIFHQEFNILQMHQSRSGDTLDYKVYEITLYPVPEGNAQSLASDEKDFFY